MHQDNSDTLIAELLASKDGHKQAFDIIVKRYSRPLYYYLRRILVDHYDTDDVLQETFIKVWQNIDKYKGEAHIYNWMIKIATHQAFDFLKAKAKSKNVSIDALDIDVADQPQQDPLYRSDYIDANIHKAILSLPKKQQMVFNLKHFEGLKYSEISQMLGTSEGALKSSYHIAIEKIRTLVLQQTNE